jgi:MerR family transcriptional regulator, light-induced transcriptional regulator
MRISELSRRVGVASDTLRVWERRYGVLQPRRTPGNIRLYSALDEARIRLMKRYLSEAVAPAQAAELVKSARLRLKPGHSPQLTGHDATLAAKAMTDALEGFDESSAEQALQQLLSEYSTLAVIRDVIMPYLYEVGERWAANHMTVAQEHFASNFVHSRLLALARGWDRGLGPHALLACAPEEWHTLGLIAFGIALHAQGWRITYLGAATPVEMLDPTARRLRPDLITVAASMPGQVNPFVPELRALARDWSLALAGPAANAQLASRCDAMLLTEDPVTAAASIAARPHPGRASAATRQ